MMMMMNFAAGQCSSKVLLSKPDFSIIMISC